MIPNCDCGLTGGCPKCWEPTYGNGQVNIVVAPADIVQITRQEHERLLEIERITDDLCREHGTFHAVFDRLRRALKASV